MAPQIAQEDEVTVVEVPFDDATFARLCEFCESIGEPMKLVIFSMVHAVLEDPRVEARPGRAASNLN